MTGCHMLYDLSVNLAYRMIIFLCIVLRKSRLNNVLRSHDVNLNTISKFFP